MKSTCAVLAIVRSSVVRFPVYVPATNGPRCDVLLLLLCLIYPGSWLFLSGLLFQVQLLFDFVSGHLDSSCESSRRPSLPIFWERHHGGSFAALGVSAVLRHPPVSGGLRISVDSCCPVLPAF